MELGSGRGLAGLVASKVGADCILTDNDEEAVELLQYAVSAPNNNNDASSLLLLQEDGRKGTGRAWIHWIRAGGRYEISFVSLL